MTTKWVPVIQIALVLVAFVIGAWFGVLAFHTKPARTIVDTRPRISAHASLAQVNANLKGKPYVSGQLAELPGFKCQGWTNGAKNHGWVVIRCTR